LASGRDSIPQARATCGASCIVQLIADLLRTFENGTVVRENAIE